MMADNGITHSFEAMKAACIEANYIFREHQVIGHYDFKIEVFTPDKWYYAAVDESAGLHSDEQVMEACWSEVVEKAYKHLLEKRQAQAMREFVGELSEMSYFFADDGKGYTLTANQQVYNIKQKAQKLMGKE